MLKKFLASSRNGQPALRDRVLHPFRGPKADPAKSGYKHIELEYPIYPKPRQLHHGRSGNRLMAQLATSLPAARELAHRIAGLHDSFVRIPVDRTPELDPATPTWENGWFPALDAVTLYGLVATRNPRWYVEVGSGNSTRFVRRAIRDHGLRTRILSIDPCPRAEIDAICDEVVRKPLEDADLEEVAKLTSEDLLFVDSSHRSFQNSDVTVFFTEILPALPPGLVYGMHDIYLPHDYPPEMAERFYSEQYLLACYLAGGANGDQIVAPLSYLHQVTDVPNEYKRTFDQLELTPLQRYGNSFWLQRAAQ